MQRILHRYAQLQSTDLDQVQSHVAAVLCPHDLQLYRRDQALNTELYYRPSPRLGFGRLRYGAAVHIRPQPLENFYLLQIPIDGHEQIQVNNQRFNYDVTMASMLNPDQEFEMQHSDQANKLFVRICRSSLEQFFQQHYQRPLHGALLFSPLQRLQQGAGQSLWHLLQWQFSEASEGVLFDSPQAIQRLEDTFFATLFEIWPHNQQLAPNLRVTPHVIKQAKDYIQQQLTAPLTVSLIAAAVGISTRSLYASFKQFVGLSPMQYVKQQRLEQAHQQLLDADPQQHTVTQIALLAGFTHLGQFAVDYQRQYGVRPSVTLQKSE
ncbi:AraC family transcriptional regulator [Paenalcaligenes faecalis]|uniref:AraC family transcriptional regulator n=1 Tax=Paenalcaligenes faecalis TaxID=2980099 RepID=UPI0022B9B4CF|nr:AraC family transcriptional regulator [Paenalcaligenes faecalis]